MSRFQAQIDPPTEEELEFLRQRLGLQKNQKANLLREITTLASWCVRLASEGQKDLPISSNPVLDSIRRKHNQSATLALSVEEAARLREVMETPFVPTAGLKKALARLASVERLPPAISWSE